MEEERERRVQDIMPDDVESDGRYVEFSEELADEDDREAQQRARQADERAKRRK